MWTVYAFNWLPFAFGRGSGKPSLSHHEALMDIVVTHSLLSGMRQDVIVSNALEG
jgi:hypothetical protein